MSQYFVSVSVEKFILKQVEFISEGSPQNAEIFFDSIYSRFEILAKNPFIGRDASMIKKDHRVWADKKYKLYIYYNMQTGHIRIIRIVSMLKKHRW